MQSLFIQDKIPIKLINRNIYGFKNGKTLQEISQGISMWNLYSQICEAEDDLWDVELFFNRYYENDVKQAKKNFIESLAAFQIQFFLWNSFNAEPNFLVF